MKKKSFNSKEDLTLPDPTLDLSQEIAAEEEEDELAPLDADQMVAERDPELTESSLENLTEWDEPPGTSGRRHEAAGLVDESEFSRKLAEDGVGVADDEQREQRALDEQLEEAEELQADAVADKKAGS